jgi:hypothetical protein
MPLGFGVFDFGLERASWGCFNTGAEETSSGFS